MVSAHYYQALDLTHSEDRSELGKIIGWSEFLEQLGQQSLWKSVAGQSLSLVGEIFIVHEVGAVVLGENELTIWSPLAMDVDVCQTFYIQSEAGLQKKI